MTDLATLLAEYPALSPADRAAVDARVADHPEMTDAHRDAQALAALLDRAYAAPDADDIARIAVDRRMGRVSSDADAVLAARAADPALDAESDRIEARLDELEAGMADPVARFEALTGLTLPPLPETRGDTVVMAAAPVSAVTAPDRRPARISRMRRAPRWAAAAAVLLVAYGGAFAFSASSFTPREQVAALDEVRAEQATVLRGEDGVAGSDDLTAAIASVRGARRSVIGLFPSYDTDALDAAAEELAAVVEGAEPESWVSQEARLALGRVHLYQGRDADAVRVLGTLVAEGSYRASVARRLIDFVRAQ